MRCYITFAECAKGGVRGEKEEGRTLSRPTHYCPDDQKLPGRACQPRAYNCSNPRIHRGHALMDRKGRAVLLERVPVVVVEVQIEAILVRSGGGLEVDEIIAPLVVDTHRRRALAELAI